MKIVKVLLSTSPSLEDIISYQVYEIAVNEYILERKNVVFPLSGSKPVNSVGFTAWHLPRMLTVNHWEQPVHAYIYKEKEYLTQHFQGSLKIYLVEP